MLFKEIVGPPESPSSPPVLIQFQSGRSFYFHAPCWEMNKAADSSTEEPILPGEKKKKEHLTKCICFDLISSLSRSGNDLWPFSSSRVHAKSALSEPGTQ